MRILSIKPDRVTEVLFLNAGRTPGGFYVDRLPIHEAVVDELPDGVAAIIATGDLQGRERFQESRGQPPRLLGEVLPSRLVKEILPGLALPLGRIGVLLTGDFYTVPALDRRGGTGDVTAVWDAFGAEFDWVVGVAGNHDAFGPDTSTSPRFGGNLHYLDNDRVDLDGLSIAGLGGIIGDAKRHQRRSCDDYCCAIESLLEQPTDILILHDGPNMPEQGLHGSESVRELLELCFPKVLVRGHAHWEPFFVDLHPGLQVLNVDARVVILRT